ncbi:hypothetical protein QBZ16_003136 [Prototheca wickerhamii]|uniref:Protein transport protein Sec24-like n=1 Tax=Prototheca wickerhamii TaxID=3111 RepID=A0AAD9IJ17_PROWI|nr:hypothetical protein QBZ16_003136 [Prototheca wickerhamii]
MGAAPSGSGHLVGPPPPGGLSSGLGGGMGASASLSPPEVELAIPASQSLRGRWHLPLGAVLAPMSEAGGPVPVVDMGAAGIVRCARCRTYINPHVTWLDGGRSFSCNVCATVNQTPVEYFAALDGAGRRVDLAQRPELRGGTVEYVAPAEYMVRAPQPPSYVFVIDVSFPAVSSGMLASVCATIRAQLDAFHGDSRTQVGFITFDSAVHYYALRPGAATPTMHVVADTEELFVPLPDELLGNLVECRTAVESLLDALPRTWARATGVDSATGPALQAAFLVMGHVGGKMLLFQAAPPSVGIGRLRAPARDNPALYGTDREYSLRIPDDPFYKRFAAECSRCHICVDVFAFGSTYLDLASLGAMPKYLGGQLYAYPHFQAARDGARLARELARNLSRETGWEAVMRIRCSKGLRVTSFFGHFFIRTSDLLSLPVVDADKAFSVEIAHDESVLTGQTAFVQSALLYTASNGERRIRVHTAALPVVSDVAEMYRALDAGATVALLGKAAVERSLASKLEDVRATTQHRLLLALRDDERAVTAAAIVSGPVETVLRLAYPAVYDVGPQAALEDAAWGLEQENSDTGATITTLPHTVPAGIPYCNPSSAYLIDNGRICVLWLGASLDPAFYERVFGSAAAAAADPASLDVEPARQGSDLSLRLNAVLRQLRKFKELSQPCWVIRQGSPQEALIAPMFVEDPLPTSGSPGFLEYMQVLQRDVLSK